MSGPIRHALPGWPPAPSPFAQVVDDGLYLHFSGIVAADLPESQRVPPGDPGRETAAILAALDAALRGFGRDLGDLVRVWVHVTDIEAMPAVDAAYAAAFGDCPLPARTCVAVTGLFGGCTVEITATARKG